MITVSLSKNKNSDLLLNSDTISTVFFKVFRAKRIVSNGVIIGVESTLQDTWWRSLTKD